jgi:hypothetical protein
MHVKMSGEANQQKDLHPFQPLQHPQTQAIAIGNHQRE